MLILIIFSVAVNIYLARKKNRSIVVWIFLGLTIHLVSTVALLIMKPRPQGRPNRGPLVVYLILIPIIWISAENAFYSQKQATKIIQALERYKKDNNIYPATLEELVPRYLGSVPTPKLGGGSINKFYYDRGFEFSLKGQKDRLDDPQKYRLTYFIVYVMRTTYIPSQHKWVTWD